MKRSEALATPEVLNVVVDDGGRIAVIDFRTGDRYPFVNWEELLSSLLSRSVIHVEKGFQEFDRLMKAYLIAACKQLQIDLLTYPNQSVMNVARDEGVPFRAQTVEEHYAAAANLRQAIIDGSAQPMHARINAPKQFDALNKMRKDAQLIYQMMRTSKNGTRELPRLAGVRLTAALQAQRQIEIDTAKRLAGWVRQPPPFSEKPNTVLEQLLEPERLLKFVALIETVVNAGGGFNSVWDCGGFFAHSYGSSWSAHVDHDWLPAWIRNHEVYGPTITHKQAKAFLRPLGAYKEFKKEYRTDFHTQFKPALKWLYDEVSSNMGVPARELVMA